MFFILKELWVVAYSSGPVVECNDHTVFCWHGISGFPILKYKSTWVGILHTMVSRKPSGCGMTSVSKKGIKPSAIVSSTVNWIPWSIELMCSRNSLLYANHYHKGIINIPSPMTWGVDWVAEGFQFKIFHKQVCYYGDYGWPHVYLLQLFFKEKSGLSACSSVWWWNL